MARIDYSNVSISLQQFEAVASGKYNAGEVKLAGQNSLDRVNNHVHFTRFNNVTICHAEVVAIKNAFVRALSEGGVSSEELCKVRAQLGLAPSGAADAKLEDFVVMFCQMGDASGIKDVVALTIEEGGNNDGAIDINAI